MTREEERGETQAGSEDGSGDDEGCKKDPNFVGILLGSSADSEPLCEMTNEWTPTPQPLVVDTGAAETVIPNTWWQVTFQVANVNKALGSKTVRNGHRVVFVTSGSYIENRGTGIVGQRGAARDG